MTRQGRFQVVQVFGEYGEHNTPIAVEHRPFFRPNRLISWIRRARPHRVAGDSFDEPWPNQSRRRILQRDRGASSPRSSDRSLGPRERVEFLSGGSRRWSRATQAGWSDEGGFDAR